MSRPRMRPIKPEIWHSRDFRALSDLGRLCFVALISHADDEGRLKTDAAHIAENMLMGNLPQTIQRELQHMEALDMIVTYEERGKRYLSLKHWLDHQKVPHAKPSELPPPPKFKRSTTRNNSQSELDLGMNLHAVSRKRSLPRAPVLPDPDPDPDPDPEEVLSTRVDLVLEVFETWKAAAGKNGRTVLDDKREALIRRALAVYGLEDVLDAVKGWQQLPHNRGENDRQRPYNDIELLLRDPKHIELYRDAQRGLITTAGKEHPLDQWAHRILEEGQ